MTLRTPDAGCRAEELGVFVGGQALMTMVFYADFGEGKFTAEFWFDTLIRMRSHSRVENVHSCEAYFLVGMTAFQLGVWLGAASSPVVRGIALGSRRACQAPLSNAEIDGLCETINLRPSGGGHPNLLSQFHRRHGQRNRDDEDEEGK
jgi:hypothetical protein